MLYRTADREHCFDLSGLISAVGVTDIYSRQTIIYLRRNFLLVVCNYTGYQNLQKNSLPNPFGREKAGDKAGTVSVHAAQKKQRMSALRSQFVTQMQMHKYVYRTADREHCFDLSGLISAVGVTDIYARQYMSAKEFFACGV